ncbi:MAG: fatty acid desaturase [Proteobacteria bacterium]|nr:fatty acid desaturase [Pseudomonadota bacterium]
MTNASPNASGTATPAAATDHSVRSWREIVGPYAQPDSRRAVAQLLNTGLPFIAIVGAMLFGVHAGVWAALLLAVPAAALLVRLFMIQHDCGHGSFFASRLANDLLGRTLAVLTLTPYAFWRRRHALHHATSGNLDRRGVGDVALLTADEYLSRPLWRRAIYRLYRHPAILFGFAPTYLFLIRFRIPLGHPLRHRQDWVSILGTNVLIAAVVAVMAYTVGLVPFLLSYLPVILMAATIGVWLFYVQHQFEDAYWQTEKGWNFHAAALEGASLYDLPSVLRWITADIGLHHVHHLSSKIPNYRLRGCFEQNLELWKAKRLTLLDGLKCIRLAIWDEEQRKLIPFRQVRRRSTSGSPRSVIAPPAD